MLASRRMNEADQIAAASLESAPDFSAMIASLRTAGAGQFDAVHLYYLDMLSQRTNTHQGSVKRMLETKLAQALAAFEERFAQARSDARDTVAQSLLEYPHAANELEQHLLAGDFKGMRRIMSGLKHRTPGASLGALLRQLEQHSAVNTEVRVAENTGARAELKTLRNFRNTWSKLSADKQVAQALVQAPVNAGPINSHMLVLQSLALMRDISPDYLNRFMSYADTLLCLDQCERKKPGVPKKPALAKSAKK